MDPTTRPIIEQLKAIQAGSRARHAAYQQQTADTFVARQQAAEQAQATAGKGN